MRHSNKNGKFVILNGEAYYIGPLMWDDDILTPFIEWSKDSNYVLAPYIARYIEKEFDDSYVECCVAYEFQNISMTVTSDSIYMHHQENNRLLLDMYEWEELLSVIADIREYLAERTNKNDK